MAFKTGSYLTATNAGTPVHKRMTLADGSDPQDTLSVVPEVLNYTFDERHDLHYGVTVEAGPGGIYIHASGRGGTNGELGFIDLIDYNGNLIGKSRQSDLSATHKSGYLNEWGWYPTYIGDGLLSVRQRYVSSSSTNRHMILEAGSLKPLYKLTTPSGYTPSTTGMAYDNVVGKSGIVVTIYNANDPHIAIYHTKQAKIGARGYYPQTNLSSNNSPNGFVFVNDTWTTDLLTTHGLRATAGITQIADIGYGRIIIGDYGYDAGGGNTFCGRAYLFDYYGNLIKTIYPPGGISQGIYFGGYVNIGSGKIFINDNSTQVSTKYNGAVHVYDMNGELEQTITRDLDPTDDLLTSTAVNAPDAFTKSMFGQGIWSEGGVTVIGAVRMAGNGTNSSTPSNDDPMNYQAQNRVQLFTFYDMKGNKWAHNSRNYVRVPLGVTSTGTTMSRSRRYGNKMVVPVLSSANPAHSSTAGSASILDWDVVYTFDVPETMDGFMESTIRHLPAIHQGA